MAYYFIYPEIDATLYSHPNRELLNSGHDEILELVKEKQNDGNKHYPSRILIKFSNEDIKDVIANKIGSTKFNSTNSDVRLKLYAVQSKALTSILNIDTFAVSQSWHEGKGRYSNLPTSSDGTSWIYRDNDIVKTTWMNDSVATATLTFDNAPSLTETITLIDASATPVSKTYTAHGSEILSENKFNRTGTTAAMMTSLKNCIESADGHNGTITVVDNTTTNGATTTFAWQNAPLLNETITLIDTAGTSLTFTAKAEEDLPNRFFNRQSSLNGVDSFIRAVESYWGFNGTIEVTDNTSNGVGNIILTQAVGGSDGNTTVTSTLSNVTTANFTGGGTTAENVSLTLTQATAGTAGNTTITSNLSNVTVSGFSGGNTVSFYPGTTGSISSSLLPEGGGNWWTGSGFFASQQFISADNHDTNLGVLDIVRKWSASLFASDPYPLGIPNNGFIIKKPDSIEAAVSSSFGEIQYFSVDTHTIYPPRLCFKWDDSTHNKQSVSKKTGELNVSLYRNKKEYNQNDVALFRVNVRDKYPTRTFTTSSNYLNPGYFTTASYYSVREAYTEEEIIPFDTSFTKMSADDEGMYFHLYMKSFQPERYYRILFSHLNDDGNTIYDDEYIFKVIR